MAILSTLSPADIQLWVETVLVYLATFAAAIVTAATATLRTLNIILPILEEWYPREGGGEWRPKIWAFIDKAHWTIQRLSGAGQLPSQPMMHSIRRQFRPVKEKNS
jgi:hypothetical protein